MPKRWSWLTASLALAAAAAFPISEGAARAATILERTVTVEIQPDGGTSEHHRLSIRFDAASDLAAWSPFPIYLDDNRTLVDLDASATRPDGQAVKIGRKGLDTAEVAAEGELHSSRKLRTVEIPAVPVGSVFTVDYRLAVRPYFPAGAEDLGPWRDRVEKLRIEIKGGREGWRWRLDGPRDGLTVEETPGGVAVTAAGRAGVEPPDDAPAETGAVLRFAWGPRASWEDVGRWYQGLLDQVPHGSEAIRQKARELTRGISGAREKAQALAAFAQREVRYVAVEVGIGGYRPAAPADVLARRWGDCKDKAVLLADLLAAAGIEAYPALIRLDPDGRIDRDFPSPDEFNHVIVAIPSEGAGGLSAAAADPAASGLLWVDATQTSGSLNWLHPGVQDQDALVVRGERSLLAHTPQKQEAEARILEVDLKATAEGKATGQVRLELQGQLGAAWERRLTTDPPTEIEGGVRRILAGALPGATLLEPHWKASREGVPRFEITAKVEYPRLFSGDGPARSFLPTLLTGFPAPSLVEGRTLPVILSPGTAHTTWKIRLPAGSCPLEKRDVESKGELGSFRQSVALKDGLLTVDSRTDVSRRWVDPAQFPALKELALAEYRSQKRRVRLECPPAGAVSVSAR